MNKGGWRSLPHTPDEVSAPSISMKHTHWRQLPQLSLLGLALLLGLSACIGLSTTPTAQPTIGINTNPGNLSPTPAASAYLVGAQVSNSTVSSGNGSITVQVFFHHGQLPQPGGQVSLYFHFENGGGIGGLNNQGGRRTTGSDGIAIFPIGFSGLPANMPISIDVTVHFSGIADIVKKDATSFSVVNTVPSVTPTFPNPGG